MFLVHLIILSITVAGMVGAYILSPPENKDAKKLESPISLEAGSDRTVVTNTRLDQMSLSFSQIIRKPAQRAASHDVNNWMETASYRVSSPTMNISQSVPDFTSKPPQAPSRDLVNSSESIVFSTVTSNLHEHLNAYTQATSPVKRSKSTGYLNTNIKVKKREQRKKSIHYEKSFLSNVNENLLPPVLRSGESPIMELKRKQFNDFSATIPEEDDCSFNLPHISEFGEPAEQYFFEGFDQDTRIIPEKYEQAFTGLENIPEAIDKSWLHTRRSVSSPLNHISFDDWLISADDYRFQRSRSGASLSIPGITRLASDHNLKPAAENNEATVDENHLFPPFNHTIDNIDEVSDIKTNGSSRMASNTALNRSFSAPSLHTYRKTSYPSMESLEHQLSPVSRCVTPEDVMLPEKPPTPKSSSPLKRLLQDSPKKLSSVFRRMSTATVDHSFPEPEQNWSHQHNKSVVSYQNSMNSLVSSRSTSPKRSLKSLLPSVSHKKNLSTNSFASLSQSAVVIKHNISFVNKLAAIETPIDNWDVYTRKSSNNSHVSSVPSAIIGEYDREKWRKLKELHTMDQQA